MSGGGIVLGDELGSLLTEHASIYMIMTEFFTGQ